MIVADISKAMILNLRGMNEWRLLVKKIRKFLLSHVRLIIRIKVMQIGAAKLLALMRMKQED